MQVERKKSTGIDGSGSSYRIALKSMGWAKSYMNRMGCKLVLVLDGPLTCYGETLYNLDDPIHPGEIHYLGDLVYRMILP